MVDQTLDRATNSIAVAKAAAQDARELAVARVALDDEALAEVELAGLCDFALALAATEQEGRRLADGPEVRGRDVERYCAGGARARACWAEAGRERLGRVLLQVNAVGAWAFSPTSLPRIAYRDAFSFFPHGSFFSLLLIGFCGGAPVQSFQ